MGITIDARVGVQQEELLIGGLVGQDGPGRGLGHVVFHLAEIGIGGVGRIGMPDRTGTVQGNEVGPVKDGR